MTASTAPSHAPFLCEARLIDWLELIADFGLACVDRLVAAYKAGQLQVQAPTTANTASAPVPRNPAAAVDRIGRAILWAVGLIALLDGNYDLPPGRAPAQPAATADHPGLPGGHPKAAPVPNFRTCDSAMNAAFRNRPVGQVIARICRDLGVGAGHQLWPAGLVALTQTAAELAARTAMFRQAERRALALHPPIMRPGPPEPAFSPPPDPRAAPRQAAP